MFAGYYERPRGVDDVIDLVGEDPFDRVEESTRDDAGLVTDDAGGVVVNAMHVGVGADAAVNARPSAVASSSTARFSMSASVRCANAGTSVIAIVLPPFFYLRYRNLRFRRLPVSKV